MAGVDRDEFRDFTGRFQLFQQQFTALSREVTAQGTKLDMLLEARHRVAEEMPDVGNFKITKLHVGIFVGTVIAVIGTLKLLKVIP